MRRQQRAAERRKNFLFVGAAIAVAVILIAAAVIPAYLHDQSVARKNKAGYQAKPTAAERAAGCLGVHNDPISSGGTTVHTYSPIDYSKEKFGDTRGGTPPIPPTGGRHNPVSLGDTNRFYPVSAQPRPERAVHNLEHGYVVAWYDAKLPNAQVAALQASAFIQDDGMVTIASVNADACNAARKRIEDITADVEVGRIYEGTVLRLLDFGAIVQILPGRDGLLHISQIAKERVNNVSDYVKEGQIVRVKVLEADEKGRVRLSMKAATEDAAHAAAPAPVETPATPAA